MLPKGSLCVSMSFQEEKSISRDQYLHIYWILYNVVSRQNIIEIFFLKTGKSNFHIPSSSAARSKHFSHNLVSTQFEWEYLTIQSHRNMPKARRRDKNELIVFPTGNKLASTHSATPAMVLRWKCNRKLLLLWCLNCTYS